MWFGADELGGTRPPSGPSKRRRGASGESGEPLDVHVFSTFFFAKLEKPGYKDAKLNRWTKKVRSS